MPGIEVVCDTIFGVEGDALVSPANSFGRMDGGLDADIIEFLGEDVEIAVQRAIAQRHGGELVVGLAEVVPTGITQFPFLVCAPTMRCRRTSPKTVNAYLAFRGALRAVRDYNDWNDHPIHRLVVPGLCTANGFMPPLRAARQMRAAYDHIAFGKAPNLDISLDAGADSDDRINVRLSEARPPA